MGEPLFLFIDESLDSKHDTSMLGGVLIPVGRYTSIRDAMFRFGHDLRRLPPDHFEPPLEFHGCDMLTDQAWATDDDRIAVFEFVARLINEERVRVVATGHLQAKSTAVRFEQLPDPKLYAANFLDLTTILRPVLAEHLVIPVFDGIPGGILENNGRRQAPIDLSAFRTFITSVYAMQGLRAASERLDRSISVSNYKNIAEPVFTDSAHSTGLQLADVGLYLLHTITRCEREGQPHGFRQRILNAAQSLDPSLVTWEWRYPDPGS